MSDLRKAVKQSAQDWALYFEPKSGGLTFAEREAEFDAALDALEEAAERRGREQIEAEREYPHNIVYPDCRVPYCDFPTHLRRLLSEAPPRIEGEG